MKSVATIATETGIPVLELIRTSRNLGLDTWVSDEDARKIIDKVGEIFTLSDSEARDLHAFLMENPKARSAFQKFAGIEALITQQEADKLIEAICRQLAKELDVPLRKKVTPAYLSRAVMNIGLLDVYRSAGSSNDVQGFVQEYILPQSFPLAVQVLTRYYTNVIQTMTPERARAYVHSLRQKHTNSRSE